MINEDKKSQRQKMLEGDVYSCSDPELSAMRKRSRELFSTFNQEADATTRREMLKAMLGRVGTGVWIEPPFYCDYGVHTLLGDDVFFNYNCVILDCALVTIGNAVKFGPGVQIYTACHPIDAAERKAGIEFAQPITIGTNAWIGGGAIVCPGIEIGENAVIGAGSVVTKSIPANVVAVGNPCRVIKEL